MKKITTLLLALLLVIPAMADKTIYLTPGVWDVDGATFWVHSWGGSSTVDPKMTDSDSDGVYEVSVPDDNNSIIFCRMNPSYTSFDWNGVYNQTSDLTISGDYNHYTITGWGANDGTWSVFGSTDVPASQAPAVLHIRGNINGADNWDPGQAMTLDGNVYSWTGTLTKNKEFKFITAASGWSGTEFSTNGTVSANTEYTITGGSGNCKWGGATGEVTVTMDFTNSSTQPVLLITPKSEVEDPEPETPSLSIRGFMNGWGETDMPYDEATQSFSWTGDITTGNEFKIYDGSWYGYEHFSYAEEYPIKSNGGNIQWTGNPGNITITVNKDVTTMTIVQNTSTELTAPEKLYLRGIDSNWDPGIEMTKDGNIFTWTGEVVENQEFKFFDGSNWLSVGGTIEENITYPFGSGDNTVWSTAGTITFVVDYTDVANPTMMAKDFVGEVISYEENIVRGAMYYMHPSDEWKIDNAWFAAYFFNQNNGNFCWVQGEMLDNGYVAFYLPAVTRAETDFTHVIFTRMNPNFNTLEWDAENEPEETLNVWNKTGDLTYPGYGYAYEINGWESEDNTGNWIDISSAVDRVEVAGGIVYANGVVAAEGAIEVYNVGGAIVARGNDNVDLRALNAGVYIVRNGNQVRKVVR